MLFLSAALVWVEVGVLGEEDSLDVPVVDVPVAVVDSTVLVLLLVLVSELEVEVELEGVMVTVVS